MMKFKKRYLALIHLMAVLSRMSGGGLGARYLPKQLTWLPELAFAGVIGCALFSVLGNYYIAIISAVWSYLWMQTGHGTVLHWGRDPSQAIGRKQTLTPLVDFIAVKLGFKLGDVNYCRLFMAVKGFLIGLPLGGIPLAILWPLAYEIGYHKKSHAASELLAGAFTGLSILIFMVLT